MIKIISVNMPVMVNLIASIIKRWTGVYEKTGAKVAVKRKNSVLSDYPVFGDS